MRVLWQLLSMVVILVVTGSAAQYRSRGRSQQDIDREESVRVRTTPKPRPPPPPPQPATGDQWPYRPRGENPIFNFDGGDKEDIFLMNTFPNLVDELYDMANAVKDGTKVTKAYVKAFEECSQC